MIRLQTRVRCAIWKDTGTEAPPGSEGSTVAYLLPPGKQAVNSCCHQSDDRRPNAASLKPTKN